MKENKTPCYFYKYKEENAILFKNRWDDDDFRRDFYEITKAIGYDEVSHMGELIKIHRNITHYGFTFGDYGDADIYYSEKETNAYKLRARIGLVDEDRLRYGTIIVPLYFSKEEFIEHFSKSKNPLKELKESLEGVFTIGID